MKFTAAIIASTICLAASAHAQTVAEIYIAIYLEFQPESTDSGVPLLHKYVVATRKDPGNLRALALHESGRPDRFVVIEAWSDQAAYAAHQSAAHTQTTRGQIETILRAPPDERVNSGFSVDRDLGAGGSRSVFVVTHVDVPGTSREQGEALLQRLAEASRKDKGLVRYDIYQQQDRPNHFTVFANWDSRDSFDANGHTDHWRTFRQSLSSMLGALYDERLYENMTP